ncbi:PA0069 family radical SAM protein [Noviherbaspirillum galbum]|uniref:PA0069 family radical SAM protein n=1 Tax=Noviherbaspirillum galbum TaxID=2709383 RepID=A0A6B3SP19_9BURK|nr:PA0069 family radical SAM protein [Noviherbaspirillum galbum]NEX61035.1 PA0069 family radical SAM protein [Noviherbaspirillum galbum]
MKTEPLRPIAVLKGRGIASNVEHRLQKTTHEAVDDGWAADDEPAPAIQTQVTEIQAKSIVSSNKSPDIPFSLSINPYLGCEHGCAYCYARPTHAYLELSPGLDFETRLFAKTNAAGLLRTFLSRPGYVAEPIAVGVNTDAYQPIERELKITRQILELLCETRHPVSLITKSSLIERDIDLLKAMAERRLCNVVITITTLDADMACKLEPRATTPLRRLRTVKALADAGIPVGVNIAPVIPFITEPDIERILKAAHEAGAVSAGYIVLRLPNEVSPIFQEWLEAHYPDRARRVMNRIQEMRAGRENDPGFHSRMTGSGVWAQLIRQRFDIAANRLGLTTRARDLAALDCTLFEKPERERPAPATPQFNPQLNLF